MRPYPILIDLRVSPHWSRRCSRGKMRTLIIAMVDQNFDAAPVARCVTLQIRKRRRGRYRKPNDPLLILARTLVRYTPGQTTGRRRLRGPSNYLQSQDGPPVRAGGFFCPDAMQGAGTGSGTKP